MKQLIRGYIIWLALTITSSNVFGQDSDSLFAVAKENASLKKYDIAISLSQILISKYPENTDYRIFQARVYAWKGETDSARTILTKVVLESPVNSDAYDALTDIELWSGHYIRVIDDCKYALTFVPENLQRTFLLKQAKAYVLLEEYQLAKQKLNAILLKSPEDQEAIRLLNEIDQNFYTNSISASYLNVSFPGSSFPSWHFSYLEYQRNFKKCPLIGRLNYGNVDKVNGYQFEVDAYPKLSKGTYLYLNAGYSTSKDIFPQYRGGAELYQKLPKAFEVSIGGRYLQFSQENVFIFTGSVGKYLKKWWLSYRPYILSGKSDHFTSHTTTFRRYFSDHHQYLSLHLIYGATPLTTVSYQDIQKINSKRIGLDLQVKLTKGLLIKPMLSYEYEEYYPQLFRNRWYSQLTLAKRF